jgi:hypothetical protein
MRSMMRDVFLALASMLAIIASAGANNGTADQGASAPELRAAFMYNFAKFTEWPANVIGPPDRPLVFCVSDDQPMADALEQIVKGRAVGGHALSVRRTGVTGDFKSCHLLYASGLDTKRANELIGTLDRTPVLTVGDFERFAQMGGVASFFVEDGKMRFAINVDSAQRAGLRVSSKLLMLARIVKTDVRAR